MTISTLTVTDFVLARLAEDEAAARAVTPLGHNFDMGGNRQDEEFTHGRMGYASEDGYPRRLPDGGEALHFARHDPARVLAQCAAMRKIVKLHSTYAPDFCDICSRLNADYDGFEDEHPYPCPTLAALASIWSDHAEFRDEWRA